MIVENKSETKNYYKAIGVLKGTLKKVNEGNCFIVINNNEYKLSLTASIKRKFDLKKNGDIIEIAVYPRVIHFPQRDKDFVLYFRVIFLRELGKANKQIFTDLGGSEFYLNGVWQFIPCYQRPVISISRNYNTDFYNYIKKIPLKQQIQKTKTQHLPFLWKESIVPPFRYKREAQVQDQKYFLSVKAKFIPTRLGTFVFDSLLDNPISELPKAFMISKSLKKANINFQKRTESPSSKVLTGQRLLQKK